MKFWEVIKELTEDPVKRFEQRGRDWVETIACEDGFLVYTSEFRGEVIDRGGITENAHLNECDWKLVRQPVTWQEAIEAWGEGHTIKKCFPNSEQWYPSGTTIHLTKNDVVNGTWYVED